MYIYICIEKYFAWSRAIECLPQFFLSVRKEKKNFFRLLTNWKNILKFIFIDHSCMQKFYRYFYVYLPPTMLVLNLNNTDRQKMCDFTTLMTCDLHKVMSSLSGMLIFILTIWEIWSHTRTWLSIFSSHLRSH